MQLSEILEENSVKAISDKTNISEDNIELLLAEDFENLSRTKALGFISIIERDYDADLTKLKEKALEYYDQHDDSESINLRLPVVEEKKGGSKWGLFIVLALLAYASWYFLTQFDNKNLKAMLPFTDTNTQENGELKEDEVESNLSINKALSSSKTDTAGVQTDIVEMNIEPNDLNVHKILSSVTDISEDTSTQKKDSQNAQTVTLQPEKRLWFGIIDMDTGKRDHFSIDKKYELDLKHKSWLIATSSAPFSFVYQDKTQEFNDAKEHYFKVSQLGIVPLSKSEYVTQGGYKKW